MKSSFEGKAWEENKTMVGYSKNNMYGDAAICGLFEESPGGKELVSNSRKRERLCFLLDFVF